MSLIDRYLEAVAGQLPADNRDDIIAELRGLVAERIEDREAELGRAPTEAEVEAVLKGLGHPLVVAARYRDEPQHVVGPALYPFWRAGIKIGLLVLVVVTALSLAVRLTLGGGDVSAFGHATNALFSGGVMIVGLATLAAWLIERYGKRVPWIDDWRVRDLGWLDLARWDLSRWRGVEMSLRRPVLSRHTARRQEGLMTVVSGVIALLWWTGLWPIFPVLDLRNAAIVGPELASLDWVGLHDALRWPVAALLGLVVVGGAVRLIWPGAVRPWAMLRLASDGLWIVMLVWLAGWTAMASPLSGVVVGGLPDVIRTASGLMDHPRDIGLDAIATLMVWAWLLFAGLDGTARLWQVASGRDRPGRRARNEA